MKGNTTRQGHDKMSALIEYRKALIANKGQPNNEKDKLVERMAEGGEEEVYPKVQERNKYVEREKNRHNLSRIQQQIREKAAREEREGREERQVAERVVQGAEEKGKEREEAYEKRRQFIKGEMRRQLEVDNKKKEQ